MTPLLVGAQDALSNPHLDWLRQELDRIGGDTHADAPPTATPDEAWNALWATFSTTEQGSAFARAVDVMSESVPARLDPDDPATLARCRVDDILAPLSEGDALLQLSDVLSPDVLTAAKTLVGALINWLDTPLIDGPEADLCRWLAIQAGQPDAAGAHSRRPRTAAGGLSPHGLLPEHDRAGAVPRRHVPPAQAVGG